MGANIQTPALLPDCQECADPGAIFSGFAPAPSHLLWGPLHLLHGHESRQAPSRHVIAKTQLPDLPANGQDPVTVKAAATHVIRDPWFLACSAAHHGSPAIVSSVLINLMIEIGSPYQP
ncbi:hypothetical protein HU200_059264 [Digitaria exilis]|uniref:Uncharacterized protein n=1 Tax=Digitaria exilis TaxID=1010633 RepID=A0A835AD16_9POAL|nr:hypothetical protein HU200_059264 [Digitaria exilis]